MVLSTQWDVRDKQACVSLADGRSPQREGVWWSRGPDLRRGVCPVSKGVPCFGGGALSQSTHDGDSPQLTATQPETPWTGTEPR